MKSSFRILLLILIGFNAAFLSAEEGEKTLRSPDQKTIHLIFRSLEKQKSRIIEIGRTHLDEMRKISNKKNKNAGDNLRYDSISLKYDRIMSVSQSVGDLRQNIFFMILILDYEKVFVDQKIKNTELLNVHLRIRKAGFSLMRKILDIEQEVIKKNQIEIQNTTAVITINSILENLEKLDTFLKEYKF